MKDEDFVKEHNIVLCTKKGVIKKTALEDFSRPRQTGVNAITIVEGDELLDAKLTDGKSEIMMAVGSGRAIRFSEDKVRATGRGAIGVGGIDTDDGSDVVGMVCVSEEQKAAITILVVSEQGYGKRTPIDEYRFTNRGGKGVKTINVTEKTGSLVGILAVANTEDLMITCKSGVTIRMPVNGISEQGRATQGVKLIRLDEGDEIAAITSLDEHNEDDSIQDVADVPDTNSDKATDEEKNSSETNNGE